MNVLSIQSHVVYSRVGNRSAVFPLERLGLDVWPINTTQFSCHKGFASSRGMVMGSEHIIGIVDSLSELGVLHKCDAVLSGYMGDADTGFSIMHAVDAVKKANKNAIYFCDPVMGDFPEGLYVEPNLLACIKNDVLKRADIVCPNVFEAELLSDVSIINAKDKNSAIIKAAEAIHGIGPGIVIISSFSPRDNHVGFFISDTKERHIISAPVLKFPSGPKGTGDLASALFLAYYMQSKNAVQALEKMLSALYSVLEATLLSDDISTLAIIAAQDSIAHPKIRFKSEPLN